MAASDSPDVVVGGDGVPTTAPAQSAPQQRDALAEAAQGMNGRASGLLPLTDDELQRIMTSIERLGGAGGGAGGGDDAASTTTGNVDGNALRSVLEECAHLSHKDWTVTSSNAERLGQVLFPNGLFDAGAEAMFQRIVTEGNWNGAADTGKTRTDKPWAVLVTGVNGIRKTTSIYQDWFPELLQEALILPTDGDESNTHDAGDAGAAGGIPAMKDLPHGGNSFFRQLDHIIATVCNKEFEELYDLTSKQDFDGTEPGSDVIRKYSDLKAAIFTRYRTLSELVGICLLRQAQKLGSNCMVETSGRDVSMFHYIDRFFPVQDDESGSGQTGYRKLALHFVINDLSSAQESVDKRMVDEIKAGIEALNAKDTHMIINANKGGPYGSEVLPGVQSASDSVWNDQVLTGAVGQSWYKATISINANKDGKPWTVHAILPDGTAGTTFEFPLKG